MSKLEDQTNVPHNTNLLGAFNSVAVDSDVLLSGNIHRFNKLTTLPQQNIFS